MSALALVDVVLAFVVVEALLLAWIGRRGGTFRSPRSWLPNLAAGFLLALALRSALAGATTWSLAALLALAGLAHALDMAARVSAGSGREGAR